MELSKICKTRKERFILVVISVLSIILSLSYFVSALALGIGGNVQAYPGQTIDVFFDIQNLLDNANDLVMEGEFEQGSEIASFPEGNRFEVPAGSVIPVPVRYKIPENAPVGTEYQIKVIFRTVSGNIGEGGSVGFSENIRRSFTISVVEKPVEPEAPVSEAVEEERAGTGNVILWIAVIIIILLIIWWLSKRKKANVSVEKKKK